MIKLSNIAKTALYLDCDDWAVFRHIAIRRKVSASSLIRDIMRDYIKKEGELIGSEFSESSKAL